MKYTLLGIIFGIFVRGGVSFADEGPLFDMTGLQQQWISLHNQERSRLGLSGYTVNPLLNHSASKRAQVLKMVKTTTHRRTKTDGYYNYRNIKSWFANQCVGFTGNGTLFSESLGRGLFTCKQKDCTEAISKAMKKTFVYFMSEKNRASRPHYNAIISKNFTDIGMSIILSKNKYYLVSHYGKGVTALIGSSKEK